MNRCDDHRDQQRPDRGDERERPRAQPYDENTSEHRPVTPKGWVRTRLRLEDGKTSSSSRGATILTEYDHSSPEDAYLGEAGTVSLQSYRIGVLPAVQMRPVSGPLILISPSLWRSRTIS